MACITASLLSSDRGKVGVDPPMRSLDVSMADHQTGRVRDVGRAVRPRVSLGPMEPPPACGETRCAGFAFATSATRWIYEQIGREAGPDDRWIRDPRPCQIGRASCRERVGVWGGAVGCEESVD